MKKLMMALAVVALAGMANAAVYVNWKSGEMKDAAGASGSSDVMMYYFAITESEYTGFLADYNKNGDMSSVWDAYGDKLDKATNKNSLDEGSRTLRENNVTASKPAYAAIIFTDTQGGVDYYMANISEVASVGASGSNVSNLGLTIGGAGNATPIDGGLSSTKWVAQSVPEPTSAMLLLLGMAGLALRRRRA